jgi:hydrogenase-4 component E
VSYAWSDVFFVLLIVTGFILLGSSRLGVYIRVSAIQGIALGVLPIVTHLSSSVGRLVLLGSLGLGTLVLKGIVFPMLLFRALRSAGIRREPRPFVGYTASTIFGLLALIASFRVGSRLPAPEATFSTLAIPVGVFTLLVGLFLIVSRRKALTQVLGYLVLENGIFALGVTLVADVSVLVELGVLLDVFVAVFVMQIAVYHISHEFDSTDVDRLATLKD